MRILLVTPMPPDRDAPSAIQALLMAQLRGLSARNEVSLVCVAGPDEAQIASVDRLREEGFDVHPAIRRRGDLRRGWRRRAQLARGWLGTGRPWRTVWFADEHAQTLIDRLVRERSFDVVAAEDDAMAAFRYPREVPAVLTVHEMGRSAPVAASGRLRRTRDLLATVDHRRWPAYQRSACSGFERIVVFTEDDARLVADLDPGFAERVRIAPFGVELPELAPAGVEEPDTMMFAGNYSHPPNVDAAVWIAEGILPRVRERRPHARLWLAGAFAPPRVLALGALEGVEMLGTPPSLDPVLARTALVLAPLRVGGGMRMKVLHAMAAGRAVLTTPVGAAGLGFDGAPPLAIAADTAELADAAVALLSDDARRAELANSARTYVERHHSPEAMARRMEAVYAEAIAVTADRHSPGT